MSTSKVYDSRRRGAEQVRSRAVTPCRGLLRRGKEGPVVYMPAAARQHQLLSDRCHRRRGNLLHYGLPILQPVAGYFSRWLHVEFAIIAFIALLSGE